MQLRALLALLVTGAISPALMAQDSTDAITCGGGDALDPWADTASGAFGSEQVNDFVVDMRDFQTSWGTGLGIAPLIKSSKSGSAFNTSGVSAQGISRLQKAGVDISGNSYDYWTTPGTGVNNDPTANAAPTATRTTIFPTQQFGVLLSEFGTTDSTDSYNGIIGAIVNQNPSVPGRLYVSRTVAAINNCNFFGNVSQFGVGSVDEEGNVYFRADGSGVISGCGLTPMSNNHVYAVKMALRDASKQNVMSNDAVGLKDLPAVDEFISNVADVYVTPNNLPPAVTGGDPFVLTTNFGGDFVRGEAGSVTQLADFTNAFVDDGTRGSLAYTQDNFAMLGSSAGMSAILGKDTVSGGTTRNINIFGLSGTGVVTGTKVCTLPSTLTDNSTLATTLPPAGQLEFGNYQSQAPFRGGTGQVALGVDQNGDLLVAATGDHPSQTGNDHPINMIAVCKIDQNTGAESWTMAAYNDGTFGVGGSGKPILDGPGGDVIGRLVPLLNVTGGTPQGPSISSPMMDSVGNLYFISALEIFEPADFATGLVRAVYDQATFSYELELVMKTGDIHRGANSDRDYLVTFLPIADSNSVSSGGAFSGNIQEVAAGDIDASGLDTVDGRTLGGIVVSAGIIYDTNDDGDFTTCFNAGVDDDGYNMLMYIGHNKWPEVANSALAGTTGEPALEISGVLDPDGISPVNVRFSNMLPGSTVYIVIGFGQINAPFKCGTLVPSLDIILPLPTFGGELPFSFDWGPGPTPPGVPMTWQGWIPDAGAICGFAATNAVTTVTP